MTNLDKLADSVKKLQELVKTALTSTNIDEINKTDAAIGATLHSIQYGTGLAAIEIKNAVSARVREVRAGVKVEEPVKEEQPKEKQTKKKQRKSKK